MGMAKKATKQQKKATVIKSGKSARSSDKSDKKIKAIKSEKKVKAGVAKEEKAALKSAVPTQNTQGKNKKEVTAAKKTSNDSGAISKYNKTAKLIEKAKTETVVGASKTLREALSGTIKSAAEMEPAALFSEVPITVSDQEKKAVARKLTQAGTNFENVYKIAKSMKAKNYKMSESFEVRTPIMHKVLGWGFILSSENNRIQVLFKDGVKTLITNYNKNGL